MNKTLLEKPSMRIGIIAIVLTLGYVGAVTVVNDVTRIDLDRHISSQQCGPLGNLSDCPGELHCFSISQDGGRLPQDLHGNRCVTPTFEERYCGLFATNIRQASMPPGMSSCGPQYNPITNLRTLFEEENLYNRFFNTNRNGTAQIRDHGLEPLSQ
jgi:hypothetical protein